LKELRAVEEEKITLDSKYVFMNETVKLSLNDLNKLDSPRWRHEELQYRRTQKCYEY